MGCAPWEVRARRRATWVCWVAIRGQLSFSKKKGPDRRNLRGMVWVGVSERARMAVSLLSLCWTWDLSRVHLHLHLTQRPQKIGCSSPWPYVRQKIKKRDGVVTRISICFLCLLLSLGLQGSWCLHCSCTAVKIQISYKYIRTRESVHFKINLGLTCLHDHFFP